MTTPTIYSRAQLGMNPRVVSFNRITSRPALPAEVGLIVVHWPGTKVNYAKQDLGKVARGIEAWKPGEYNYLIHPNGGIGVQAGEFVGAHCKGYNPVSYGINILTGIGHEVTDWQVESFRFLLGCLRWGKRINATPFIVPHGDLGNTQCPGSIEDRWDDLTVGMRWAA